MQLVIICSAFCSLRDEANPDVPEGVSLSLVSSMKGDERVMRDGRIEPDDRTVCGID